MILIMFGCWLVSGCGATEDSSDRMSGEDVDTDAVADGYTPQDFYRQCTDVRCEFNLYEGDKMVFGVPTWHPKDTGFRLEGDPVVISVTDTYAAHPEVPVYCYDIAILGNWDPTVRISLEVKGEYGIFGLSASEEEYMDTSVEEGKTGETFLWTKPLGRGGWNPIHLTVHSLSQRGRMDFSIRKQGPGKAVFYLIEINGEVDCPANAEEVD